MTRDKDILSAIDRSTSLRPRSSLHQWLLDNHDAFKARLEKKMPDWTVLAKLFADGGLTNRYGKPPKAETARKAWQTVRRDVAKARAGNVVRQKRLNASPAQAEAGQTEHVGQRTAPDRPPVPSEPIGRDENDQPRFQKKSVVMRGVPTSKKE